MHNPFKLNLVHRPRRLRRTAALRALVEDTVLRPSDLIAPLFVIEGKGRPEPVASMPGVYRLSIRDLVRECRTLRKLGILAVALFPKLDSRLKDEDGTAALREDALILRAVQAVKRALPEMIVMTDIALDPYTVHGHDGVLTPDGRDVDYYGPFRDAVGSARAAGTRSLDKRTYQLNPANWREALTELALDEAEGADIMMVKPAGPYLDIIRELRGATRKPIAAYQVSGEYAQIHAAAKLGWLDLAPCRRESLTGIKRAGAGIILTYFAKEMAAELGRGGPSNAERGTCTESPGSSFG